MSEVTLPVDGRGAYLRTSISERLLHINVQRSRYGLVFKAHRLCVSLKSRLERNNEEEKKGGVLT